MALFADLVTDDTANSRAGAGTCKSAAQYIADHGAGSGSDGRILFLTGHAGASGQHKTQKSQHRGGTQGCGKTFELVHGNLLMG